MGADSYSAPPVICPRNYIFFSLASVPPGAPVNLAPANLLSDPVLPTPKSGHAISLEMSLMEVRLLLASREVSLPEQGL